MATWLEVKQYIDKNYGSENLSDDQLVLTLVIGDRNQDVFVGRVDEYIYFNSPYASIDEISPGQALRSESLFGSKEVAGFYALWHMAVLETIDVPELDLAIEMLGESADKLERLFTGKNAF